MVLVERDADMLLKAKQGLFPFVATSILTVRHPICMQSIVRTKQAGEMSAGLKEWRSVWTQVLTEQLPRVRGGVWVVRSEEKKQGRLEGSRKFLTIRNTDTNINTTVRIGLANTNMLNIDIGVGLNG